MPFSPEIYPQASRLIDDIVNYNFADHVNSEISDIMSEVPNKQSFYELLCLALDGVAKFITFDHGHFVIHDPDAEEIEVVAEKQGTASAYPRKELAERLRFHISEPSVAAHVVHTKQAIREPNVHETDQYLNHFSDTKSELAVPLMLNGECISILNLESNNYDHFTEADEEALIQLVSTEKLLQAVARLREQDFYKRRLNEERERLIKLLHEASRLVQCKTISDFSDCLEVAILALMPSAIIFDVVLNDPPKQILHLFHRKYRDRSAPSMPFETDTLLPYHSLEGKAFQSQKVEVHRNLHAKKQVGRKSFHDKNELNTTISIPICGTKDVKFGVLNLYSTTDLYFSHRQDREMMQRLGEIAEAALNNLFAHLQLTARSEGNKRCQTFSPSKSTLEQYAQYVQQTLFCECLIFVPETTLPGTGRLVLKASASSCALPADSLCTAIAEVVCVEGEPQRLLNSTDESELSALFASSRHEYSPTTENSLRGQHSILAVPFSCGPEDINGVIYVTRRYAFTYQDQEMLLALGAELRDSITAVKEKEHFSISQYLNHELGSFLSTVKGLSKQLGDTSVSATENTKQTVEEIGLHIEAVSEVLDTLKPIQDLSSHSDFTADDLDSIHLEALVTHAHRLYQSAWKEFPADFKIDTDALMALPNVSGKAAGLGIVIRNLMKNAAKYVVEGGLISITARYDDESSLVFLSIQNDGEALAAGENPKALFEPGYRSKVVRDKSISGTGMGLTFCRYIVQSYCGQLKLYYTPNAINRNVANYKFEFSLPVRPQSHALARRYPQDLNDEYHTLVLKELRHELTPDEALQLKAVRNQINQIDKQSKSWTDWERRAQIMEQELIDLRQKLEALPDADHT